MTKLKKFKTIEEAEAKLKVGESYILDISDDIPEIIIENISESVSIKVAKAKKQK